jgi:CHAT domain-containing protein
MEQAIASYQQVLQVMTREAMPVEWATAMMNLATAYSDRIRGDRAENMEQAIQAYQSSLEVFKSDLLPHDCRRTARSLGNLYSDQQRWSEAVSIYQTALQAAESLYQSANLLDSKSAELSETADLPRRTAYALARMGDLCKAVETLEQGRARGLSESLERDRSDLTQLRQTHPDLIVSYQDITAQLRTLETQQRLRMTSSDRHTVTPESLRNESQRLRQSLDQTIAQIRQMPGYEAFLTLPTFNDVREVVQADRPLIYLVPTPAGSLALIVQRSPLAPLEKGGTGAVEITPLWMDDLNETHLIDLLNQTWFSAYREYLIASQTYQTDKSAKNLQTCKQTEKVWLDAIESGTRQLWEPLMAPLIGYLKEQNFQQATLIPTGYLSLLPLHAAWVEDPTTPTGKRYALDEMVFTYAPNARSINAAVEIATRIGVDAMLAIDNPLNDLPNSSREVQAAISTFSQPIVLKHEQATVEKVLDALPHCSILHLSCHGTANLTEPLTSVLRMSDGLLTLRDLLDLKLADDQRSGIRLAILSACETGLSGIKNADEAISLPTGLLQAGVAGVVASLWSVSDLSTMMLLVRFYNYWRIEKYDPRNALRQAQCWVRDTTSQQKAQYFKASYPDLFQALILLDPNYFAHPFHWAAFSYTGV